MGRLWVVAMGALLANPGRKDPVPDLALPVRLVREQSQAPPQVGWEVGQAQFAAVEN